jgi:hypothetical protein
LKRAVDSSVSAAPGHEHATATVVRVGAQEVVRCSVAPRALQGLLGTTNPAHLGEAGGLEALTQTLQHFQGRSLVVSLQGAEGGALPIPTPAPIGTALTLVEAEWADEETVLQALQDSASARRPAARTAPERTTSIAALPAAPSAAASKWQWAGDAKKSRHE